MVTSQLLYDGLIALVAVERLGELWLSKRNARLALSQGGIEVGQRHFRFMAMMHTLFLFACVAEVHILAPPFPHPMGYVALVIALLAQALRYWAIYTLGPRWNVRIIVLPNAAPVTGGPYRYLRHPNYTAVVAEILALPLVHGAWITAILFTLANAAILFVRISAEEEALGADWQERFAKLPRFVPTSLIASDEDPPQSPSAPNPPKSS